MGLSISVITPSYNQGRCIERTIQSVLSQNVPNLEYIVCDGGSHDETVAILRRYEEHLRWISEKDKGQADAVNKGIKATSGAVIGWINSDDIYYPGALATVLSFFDEHPDANVVYGEANHIDENDKVLERYYTEEWDYERLKDVCFLCQPAVFFRRRVVEKYGLLDASLRYCMDYEYWLRLGADMVFVHLDETLAGSRMYWDNKTLRDRVAVHAEINDMLKRRLGKTPTRWIYNYAFAVVDSRGYNRAHPEKYVLLLIWSTALAFLHWRHYIPPAAMRTMAGWILQSLHRRTGGLGIPG